MVKERNQKGWKLVWGVGMVVFYLVMAFLLTYSNLFDIKREYQIIIGIGFFLYGIFRGYRIVAKGF
jgi:hypothetical protein